MELFATGRRCRPSPSRNHMPRRARRRRTTGDAWKPDYATRWSRVLFLREMDDASLRDILTTSSTVAVLGIHQDPEKAAFYVPEYLHDEGYRIIGVNPVFAGATMFGEPVRTTLAEITEPVDL